MGRSVCCWATQMPCQGRRQLLRSQQQRQGSSKRAESGVKLGHRAVQAAATAGQALLLLPLLLGVVLGEVQLAQGRLAAQRRQWRMLPARAEA